MKTSLPEVWRTVDSSRVNEIMNNPDVLPFISDDGTESVDVSWKFNHPEVVTFLLGEFGCFSAVKYCSGVYEFHTQILPEGRGRWAFSFAHSAMRWMFTKTDCNELLTRVPDSHHAAKRMVSMMGFRSDFVDDKPMKYRGELVSNQIYSFGLHNWCSTAPELEETGKWLHEKIEEKTKDGIAGIVWPESHKEAPSHNRYLGAAYHCAMGDQLSKGVFIYNRWLLASHIMPKYRAKIVSEHPPVVNLYGVDISLLVDGSIDINPERMPELCLT